MLIRRGLDFPSPLSRRVQARGAPIPSPALRFVAVTGYDNIRHPRAHSAVDPPHSMPNWVVKHSRANDTRTAGSRKSRSARGFFLLYAGVAQLVEHYLAKVDVASSNLVSRSILTPHPTGGGFLLLGAS